MRNEAGLAVLAKFSGKLSTREAGCSPCNERRLVRSTAPAASQLCAQLGAVRDDAAEHLRDILAREELIAAARVEF